MEGGEKVIPPQEKVVEGRAVAGPSVWGPEVRRREKEIEKQREGLLDGPAGGKEVFGGRGPGKNAGAERRGGNQEGGRDMTRQKVPSSAKKEGKKRKKGRRDGIATTRASGLGKKGIWRKKDGKLAS